MGVSTAFTQQSVDSFPNGEVILGLLIQEVSTTPQQVGGEGSCWWVSPNQVAAGNQSQ